MNETILESVHEAVQDLHEAGVMTEVTLREFDALCLPPVQKLTRAEIRRIRLRQCNEGSDHAI